MCGVEGEERGEEVAAGFREGREAGPDQAFVGVGVVVGCGGEAERARVGEAFEARPGGFGGDAAELEDLRVFISGRLWRERI